MKLISRTLLVALAALTLTSAAIAFGEDKRIVPATRITPESLACLDSSFANLAIAWKPPLMPISSGLRKTARMYNSQRKAICTITDTDSSKA